MSQRMCTHDHDLTHDHTNSALLFVNRGWIPLSHVEQRAREELSATEALPKGINCVVVTCRHDGAMHIKIHTTRNDHARPMSQAR